MKFSEKLDALIELRGTSQAALSRKTGLAQSAISEMTKGKRRPYLDQAFALSQALKVPLDYLADDGLEEIPAKQLSQVEEDIVRLVRVLTPEKALERLIAQDKNLPLELELAQLRDEIEQFKLERDRSDARARAEFDRVLADMKESLGTRDEPIAHLVDPPLKPTPKLKSDSR